MRELGVKWVFIGGVDNCLVKMVDPVLMGVAIDKGVTVACKSVVKANPQERVGVFCKRNGRPNVIEYTEITDEMAGKTISYLLQSGLKSAMLGHLSKQSNFPELAYQTVLDELISNNYDENSLNLAVAKRDSNSKLIEL